MNLPIIEMEIKEGNISARKKLLTTLADDEQNFLETYRHLDDTCKKIAKVIIESMIDCLN